MKPYLKYLFEIAAIVLGITLSFMVDEWREERQNRQETQDVLKFILEDLKADTTRFSYYHRFVDYFDSLYNSLKERNVREFDSLVYYLNISQHIINPNIKRSGFNLFENLKKAEMVNDSLYNELSVYYNYESLAKDIDQFYNVRLEIMKRNKFSVDDPGRIYYVETNYPYSSEFYDKHDLQKWALIDSTDRNIRNSYKYQLELIEYINSDRYGQLLELKSTMAYFVRYHSNIMKSLATELIPQVQTEIKRN